MSTVLDGIGLPPNRYEAMTIPAINPRIICIRLLMGADFSAAANLLAVPVVKKHVFTPPISGCVTRDRRGSPQGGRVAYENSKRIRIQKTESIAHNYSDNITVRARTRHCVPITVTRSGVGRRGLLSDGQHPLH